MGKIGKPEQEPNTAADKTKYNGPRGSAPEGSGEPASQEEEIQALREWAEAEERDIQRSTQRRRIARLSTESAEARKAGNLDRVKEISEEIFRIECEVQERFGH